MFEHCLETGIDFYEMGSGNLFHINDYVNNVNNCETPNGIIVSDGFGNCIGIVDKDTVDKYIKNNNLHPRWMEKKEN